VEMDLRVFLRSTNINCLLEESRGKRAVAAWHNFKGDHTPVGL
jgi:hypothetical protein